MKKPDEALMTDYKLGNLDALEEIFQRYKKPILNYAFRILNNRADAEDAVGETFYILTNKKDSYTPKKGAKFSTWLYTIAHNVCINIIRKKKRIVFIWSKQDKNDKEYKQWDIPDFKNLPDENAEKSDNALFVKRAINKLPLNLREALILREYQQLSYQEISSVLSCTISKVKVLIFRGRERLRKDLLPLIEEAR
ncbi:MAG: RNA polymerase sigma factor [Candidatus Omnitrophica bacterium]|nr:RNA polymerase sigma factor [Candidatus Omnitrophota bacterium]